MESERVEAAGTGRSIYLMCRPLGVNIKGGSMTSFL